MCVDPTTLAPLPGLVAALVERGAVAAGLSRAAQLEAVVALLDGCVSPTTLLPLQEELAALGNGANGAAVVGDDGGGGGDGDVELQQGASGSQVLEQEQLSRLEELRQLMLAEQEAAVQREPQPDSQVGGAPVEEDQSLQ